MTREERDALDILEDVGARFPDVWPVVTAYRAGVPLVESLARALELVAQEPPIPTEEEVESAKRSADSARRSAERAEEAADDAAELANRVKSRREKALS